jgi:hypothetical protein
MSLTPSNVPWDPNRYKAVEYVIKYDANGTPSLDKQEADYTGVSYNFAALPSGTTTTPPDDTPDDTEDDTDQTTTQQQTTQAFGEGITPHYWKDTEDKGTFADTISDPTKYNRDWVQSIKTPGVKVEPTKAGDWRKDVKIPGTTAFRPDKSLIAKTTDFVKEGWGKIKTLITAAKESKLGTKIGIPMGFAGAIFRAVTKRPTISGSSADNSFRGVAGLYNSEIYLMNKYGSTGPTIHNPTGDTRKDDAGFNLVSWAGDYNVIGSWSRRHNMLKEADIKYEKNSKEWKAERNKIRTVWKAEKDTNTQISDLDASGSIPVASGPNGDGPKGDGPKGDRPDNRGDAGKAGGEQTEMIGSF